MTLLRRLEHLFFARFVCYKCKKKIKLKEAARHVYGDYCFCDKCAPIPVSLQSDDARMTALILKRKKEGLTKEQQQELDRLVKKLYP
jgi:hypothetical protein